MKFYDQQLNPNVGWARHALAIDEHRADFDRVPWGDPKEVRQTQSDEPDWLQQFWFAGDHADIGGGYCENESRLSDIALQWMVHAAQAVPNGIKIDASLLQLSPAADGMQHDECRSSIFRFGGKIDRNILGDATLHPTVYERFTLPAVQQYDCVLPYRPEPLRGHYNLTRYYYQGPPNRPLEREQFFKFAPVLLALAALALIFFIGTAIRSFTSLDIGRGAGPGLGAAIPIALIVLLRMYGVPPSGVDRRFVGIRDLFLVTAMIIALAAPNAWALTTGCALAIAGLVVSVWRFRQVQDRTYRELYELLPLASSMFKSHVDSPLFSHVSDLHMTRDAGTARVEGGHGGQYALSQWLSSPSTRQATFCVISGDVTDTGDREEWAHLEQLAGPKSERPQQITLAPGNHDLSTEYGNSLQNKMRLYFQFQAKMHPGVVTCLNEPLSTALTTARKDIEPSVDEQARENRARYLAAPVHAGAPYSFVLSKQHEEKAKDRNWEQEARDQLLNDWFNKRGPALFPLRLDDEASGSTAFILNSVIDSASSLGNSALGYFTEDQLERLKEHFDKLPVWTRNVLIVTHHAPFRRPGEWHRISLRQLRYREFKREWKRMWDYAFLALRAREARRFLQSISEAADRHHDVHFFILCGHRHTPVSGRHGRVFALEASSLAEAQGSAWSVAVQGPIVTIAEQKIGES